MGGVRAGELLCALLFVGGVYAWGYFKDADTSRAMNEAPLAQKVAMIDAGGWVEADQTQVKRANYLISSLAAKTGNTEQQVADKIAVTRNYLQEQYGQDKTLLSIMEEANASETLANGEVKLDDYLALYVVFYGPTKAPP